MSTIVHEDLTPNEKLEVFFPVELKRKGYSSTVFLLDIIDEKTARYGYPPESGHWGMDVRFHNGTIISYSHMKHLNKVEWEPLDERTVPYKIPPKIPCHDYPGEDTFTNQQMFENEKELDRLLEEVQTQSEVPILSKTYCHEDICNILEDINEGLEPIDDSDWGVLRGDIKVEVTYVYKD